MPATFACGKCSGTFEKPVFGLPACQRGGVMLPLPHPSKATGCYLDPVDFKKLTFEKKHFVPSTGRGKMDVRYQANSGRLDIVVKIDVKSSSGRVFNDISSREIARLTECFKSSVPRFWNRKWSFKCNRVGWESLPFVVPHFRIETAAASLSHFSMVISPPKEKKGTASKDRPVYMRECRGFVSLNQIITNDPTAKDRVELQNFHLEDFTHTLSSQIIAQHERERLEAALSRIGVVAAEGKLKSTTLLFDVLGEPEKLKLTAFANEVKNRYEGSYAIPIALTGFAPGVEKPSKASARVEAVSRYLTTLRVDNEIKTKPEETATAGVKFTIDAAFENQDFKDLTYNVAAHEFGHMLGLPDEYENPEASDKEGDNAKFQVKNRYLKLVGDAKQVPPTFPSHTSSMMSEGMTLMGFHGVTIWEALCWLTRFAIKPDEWVIHSA